ALPRASLRAFRAREDSARAAGRGRDPRFSAVSVPSADDRGQTADRNAADERRVGTPEPRESFLVYGSPEILEDEIDEVVATLRSGWLGTGPRVGAFE